MTILILQQLKWNSDGTCSVRISHQDQGTVQDAVFSVGLSNSDAEEIRWYLEDYADKNPFQTSRALRATRVLKNHERELVVSIDWQAILRPIDFFDPLILQVYDCTSSSGPTILWELLGQSQVLRASARPPRIHVIRTISIPKEPWASQLQSLPEGAPRNVLNILVISARPRAESDIAHRLVSQIILDVIDTIPPGPLAPKVNLEIVRPGTFAAFKAHLAMRGKSFFGLVHFDLHGSSNDQGRAFLSFLKTMNKGSSSPYMPDHVSAHEIAIQLQAHGVKRVVLNACRSASGNSSESNIAGAFVRAGVAMVVAMSYNVLGRAVEIFTKNLYEGILHHRMPFEGAVAWARDGMLLDPDRVSKFGSTVIIKDHVVPVLFADDSFEWPLEHPIWNRVLSSTEHSKHFHPQEDPFGREGDILRLESALLIEMKPMLIHGPPGIGKTYLLHFLIRWWKRTGLIKDSFHFECSPSMSFESIFLLMQKRLLPHKPSLDTSAVFEHLRGNRYLIAFDDVEAMTAAGTTTRRLLYSGLKSFLKAMNGGQTIVIILSREREVWLGSQTIVLDPKGMTGLATIPGLSFIQSAIEKVQGSKDWNTISWTSDEDLQYFEEIIKLVEGNPLALEMLVFDFCQKKISPKKYFFALLEGAPISINETNSTKEGYHSVFELSQLINKLSAAIKSPGDGFAPIYFALFWKVLPGSNISTFIHFFNLELTTGIFGGFHKKKNRSRYFQEAETMQHSGLLDSFPPEFRTVFDSATDISTSNHVKTVNDFISAEGLFLVLKDNSLPTLDGGLAVIDEIVKSQCERIVAPLKAAGFLRPIDSNLVPPSLHSKGYLTIHPLLPILLRSNFGWTQQLLPIASTARRALRVFYANEAKAWPMTHMYYNEAWEAPRLELDMQFANFMSAAWLALNHISDDSFVESAIARVLMCVQRSIVGDASRSRIIVELWVKAVVVLLRDEKILSAKYRPPTPWFKALVGAPATSDAGEPKSGDEFMLFTRLLQSRALASSFCAFLVAHYHRIGSKQQHEYLQLVQSIVGRLLAQLQGDWLDNNEDIKFTRLEFANLLIDTQKMVSPSSEDVNDMDMWEAREARHKALIEHYGVETYVPRRFSEFNTSLNATSVVVSRQLKLELAIIEAVDRQEFEKARKLVDEALLVEMNEASNDASNKAALYRHLSSIDEAQGRWEDALRNFDEAGRLEMSIGGGTVAPLEKIGRRAQRKRLLRKIDESAMQVLSLSVRPA